MSSRGLALGVLLAVGCAAAPVQHSGDAAPGWHEEGPHTLVAGPPARASAPARNADGTVNALIEIPAGTNAKWEQRKEDGALVWTFRDGRPREVAYLAYPANYGMIPRTLLAAEAGGDGDPLDVLVLGPALPRGSMVPVRLVGVLRTFDGGEQDDKLIAVTSEPPFAGVADLAELDARFPGVTRIVEIWFRNYKGPGAIETRGFGDVAEAQAILERAEARFPGR